MVEKYLELIDAKTAAFTSDVVTMNDLVPRIGSAGFSFFGSDSTRDAYVNFDSSGGAFLFIEASLGAGSDFRVVDVITTPGISQIVGYPRMRLRLDAVASGTHSAGIYGDIVCEGAFINALTDLQLTGNLRLCLDAGDSNSYSGSGQDWVDVSGSGNADEFHLGTADTSGAGDPTFNGTAGGLSSSEYFSSDGGDFLEYGAVNETWMGGGTANGMHHNNASFTFALWYYFTTAGLTHRFFDIGNMATSNIGIGLTNSTGDVLQLFGGTGSGTLIDERSSIKHGVNAWNFIAVAVDEASGANGSEFHVNESNEAFDASYNSPVASAATNRMHLGSSGIEAGQMPSGARIAGVMFWDKKLTTDNVNAIYNVTKSRFEL